MQTKAQKPVYIPFQPDLISPQSAQSLMNTLSYAANEGFDEIHLMMSSGGGFTKDGFTIYHFIRSLPIPVYTYNMGAVESVANMIYQAGGKRICQPESKFMIHKFSWALQGEFDAKGFREKAESLEMDQSTFAKIMMQRTKLTEGKINDMFLTATWFSAQEALNHGMVDIVRAVQIPKGAHILPPN